MIGVLSNSRIRFTGLVLIMLDNILDLYPDVLESIFDYGGAARVTDYHDRSLTASSRAVLPPSP